MSPRIEKLEPVKAAVEVALAVYSGVPGQREPDNDADTLRAIADWMDGLDDITDRAMADAGKDHRVSRGMQASLRRIAERLA